MNPDGPDPERASLIVIADILSQNRMRRETLPVIFFFFPGRGIQIYYFLSQLVG
jgi:hypothetical protein